MSFDDNGPEAGREKGLPSSFSHQDSPRGINGGNYLGCRSRISSLEPEVTSLYVVSIVSSLGELIYLG